MSEDTVPSPCVDICQMNIRLGLCVGCFRTIHEIATWRDMSIQEKLDVISELDERALDYEQE
jgi:predicted Fe-S protein YdhL (DUF1289 family)